FFAKIGYEQLRGALRSARRPAPTEDLGGGGEPRVQAEQIVASAPGPLAPATQQSGEFYNRCRAISLFGEPDFERLIVWREPMESISDELRSSGAPAKPARS